MGRYRSIVVSGLPGSGKSTLTIALAEQYRMQRYSVGDMLRAEYTKRHLETELPFKEFWRNQTLSEARKINEQLKPLFEKNRMIGDSRYVSYLDRNACMLVFVYADLDKRAHWPLLSAEHHGMTDDYAARTLWEREQDEYKKGELLFGCDYRDRKLYDISLNSGTLSVSEELNAIKGIFG